MKKYPVITFLFPILLIIPVSCSTTRISLNILKPAAIVLPANIQRITVLPVTGNVSSGYDSLRFLQPENENEAYKVKLGYIHGIYDIITQSPRFQKVSIANDTLESYRTKKVFYWDQLRNICAKDTTDIVLMLTKSVSYDFFTALNDYVKGDFIFADYYLINHSEWSFYAPYLEKEVIRLVFSDTIKIEGGFVRDEFDDIYYDVCYSTGQKVGKRIAPYWTQEERILFAGPGKDLKDAARFIQENHWYKASLIWKQLLEDKNPVKASHAAYNTALAFEQDDDPEQAFLWLNYADSISGSKYINDYRSILEIRKITREILDMQMIGE